MKKILLAIMMMTTLAGIGVLAQTSAESMMMRTAMRLENQTDWFKESLDAAFDSNRLDGTVREDEINSLVQGFEMAADRYRDRATNNQVIPSDIEYLLGRALIIEEIMAKVPASEAAHRDWMQVRNTLDTIAKRHNVVWVWTANANPFYATARVGPIFDRLRYRADEFGDSLDYALDTSKLDGSKLEDEVNLLFTKFEDNIEELEDRVDKAEPITSPDIDRIVKQGMLIDSFLTTHNLMSPRLMSDWWQVKSSLREMALRSNTRWTWTYKPVVTKTVGTK